MRVLLPVKFSSYDVIISSVHTTVSAQYLDLEFADCAEKRGALKLLRAMVYGFTVGSENNPSPDPFMMKQFSKFTQLLLDFEADYGLTCRRGN
jgi:hypothetical protein